MSDCGVVTLVFYKIGQDWWREPALNIIAAAAQGSSFTHCEIAIGGDVTRAGHMTNVARVFNDNVGVELVSRTGRNPKNIYLQLACPKASETRMLQFARRQVGKPFSGTGMARALIYPRTNDGSSWYCAELVAAILQAGGLLSSTTNPSAATPESLHTLFASRAAVTANPTILAAHARQPVEADTARIAQSVLAPPIARLGSLKVVTSGRPAVETPPLHLTMNSLDFRKRSPP